jgi:hypothetical protein
VGELLLELLDSCREERFRRRAIVMDHSLDTAKRLSEQWNLVI